MNCEDVPMSEWDKLTGAPEEAVELQMMVNHIQAVSAAMLEMDMNGSGKLV